jgi:hypothetical protein
MTARAPRELVHRGHVLAHGLLFAASAHGDALHRRVLSAYTPGSRIYECQGMLALIWPTARRLDRREQPAEPLVCIVDNLLSACPLASDERDGLLAARESIAWASEGELSRIELTQAMRVDESAWLNLEAYATLEVAPLSPPAIAPIFVEPPTADVDELLAPMRPRFDAGRAKLLAALAHKLGRAGKPAQGSPQGSTQALARPEAPGLLDRLWDAFAKLVGASPLMQAIGLRQARYLRQTLELFERGDFDEALRRAIPTSMLGGTEPKPPALSLPSPRRVLDIHRTESAGGSSINLAPNDFMRMRRVYADTAKLLEQRGRIDDAAFIYFELLHDNLAGVALLERHGRYELAAEIAEARELAPDLVVRLWFLADRRDRAITVARRTGAFSAAVARLQGDHPNEAEQLRLVWAEYERSRHDYIAAIEALWPSKQHRALLREWIDHALEHAGPANWAKLIPRKLELQPEAITEVLARVQPTLSGSSWPERWRRQQLGSELAQRGRTPAIDSLNRVLTRSLLGDLSRSPHPELASTLERLLEKQPNQLLHGDLPKLPHVAPRLAHLDLSVAREDQGTLLPYDIVALPDGGALVALGEAGVLHLDADGRARHRYTTPADHLVIASHGDRALALAQRDAVYQIWRLDLPERTDTWWRDLHELTSWARRYDGGQWFVSTYDSLLALDTIDPRARLLWRVPLSAERVSLIQFEDHQLLALVTRSGELTSELWTFQLPQLVMRARRPLSHAAHAAMLLPTLEVDYELGARLGDGRVRAANETWAVIERKSEDACTVEVLQRPDKQLRARLQLDGIVHVRCDLGGDTLWGIDVLCRAWSISLRDGSLRVIPLR